MKRKIIIRRDPGNLGRYIVDFNDAAGWIDTRTFSTWPAACDAAKHWLDGER